MLRVVSGLDRPTYGKVVLDGDEITAPHEKIGIVFQEPRLLPWLSVEGNVGFGLADRPKEERDRRVGAQVDRVGLADKAKVWPRELSGGQAQRVAVARALASEPELLLLDEPFAALDVDAAPALRAMLRRVLRDSGRTALLVTHDPLDALVLADRVVVLSDGEIVEQGETRAVLSRPRTAFTARIAGLDLVSGVFGPSGLAVGDFVISGHVPVPIAEGTPAVAVFAPAAVAVHVEPPGGSPRNVFGAVVGGLEPHGDLIRLRVGRSVDGPSWVDGLAADLTAAAVADLGLEPGARVWLAVKAAEVALHPVAGGS